MSLRFTRGLLALSALALPAACSLVDTMDGYSGGKPSGDAGPVVDGGVDATQAACNEGSKSCGGACAPFAASNGCSAAGCDPCPGYPNAAGTCTSAGACALGPCVSGFADCDGKPADGCETQLDDDPANCGACGHVCSLPNATAKCAGSACAIDTCATDYGDCNKDPSDGCETSTSSDVAHCGACDTSCPTATSATFACVGSACAIASCATGTLSCDGNPINGCECGRIRARRRGRRMRCRRCGSRRIVRRRAVGAGARAGGTGGGRARESLWARMQGRAPEPERAEGRVGGPEEDRRTRGRRLRP
ncbi:MAG TPA: hypothetical protein VGI39_30585 [Polyangiaceae bacterium]